MLFAINQRYNFLSGEMRMRAANHNIAGMMADSGSEDIAVVGNTDVTPSALENNIKNTVKL